MPFQTVRRMTTGADTSRDRLFMDVFNFLSPVFMTPMKTFAMGTTFVTLGTIVNQTLTYLQLEGMKKDVQWLVEERKREKEQKREEEARAKGWRIFR